MYHKVEDSVSKYTEYGRRIPRTTVERFRVYAYKILYKNPMEEPASGGLKNTHAVIAWSEAKATTLNIVASRMCAAGLINDCRQVAAADKGEARTNNAYYEHATLVVDDFFNLQVTQEPEIDYKGADIGPSPHGTWSPVTNPYLVHVRATKNIAAGEEIFASYGSEYFRDMSTRV